jgi:hypothetical protein
MRRLEPAQQVPAEPAFPVCRVHAAIVPHFVHRIGGAAELEDPITHHGAAVEDGDGTAGEVAERIAEALQQVLFAEELPIVVGDTDGLSSSAQAFASFGSIGRQSNAPSPLMDRTVERGGGGNGLPVPAPRRHHAPRPSAVIVST